MNTNASSMCPKCYAFLEPDGYCTKCEKVTGTSHPDTQVESDSESKTISTPRPKRTERKPEREPHFFQTGAGTGCLSAITFLVVFLTVMASNQKSTGNQLLDGISQISAAISAGAFALISSIAVAVILLLARRDR